MSREPEDRAAHERLLALAAGAAPPPLAPTDARRMVRRALLAGAARRKAAEGRTTSWLALGGFAALALVAIGVRLAGENASAGRVETAQPRDASPLRLRLPSGDTLVATPGAQFELVSADPADRRIRLHGGAIAFDVAKLGAGQHFAVVTPHVTVRVRGTVFSVAASAQRTQVRVYEGVVVVATAGGERVLHRGESYASDAGVVAQDEAAPLQRDAAEMAARRAHATAFAAPAPPVQQAVALEPVALEPLAPEPAITQRPAPPRRAQPRVQAGDSLQQARAWLHDGQAERALAAALRVRASGAAPSGDWLLLQADALRSLDRRREAAHAYRDAALLLPDERRVQAGFKAADMLLRELDDPRAALTALSAAGVDDPRSVLRERGLLLRLEALQRLGEPVAEVAGRYLAEYPDSAGAARLRALLESAR